MRSKNKGDWRILLCNINMMPAHYNNAKLDIYRHLATNEFDINLLNEVNKDQRRTKHEDRTSNIFNKWWDKTVCKDEFLIDEHTDMNTE